MMRRLAQSRVTGDDTVIADIDDFGDDVVFGPVEHANKTWIRGVNLGGWLLIERYIVPYVFAVTDCHLRGDFCWYEGQVSAPPAHSPEYKRCNFTAAAAAAAKSVTNVTSVNATQTCQPIRFPNVFGELDYPLDEFGLAQAFRNQGQQSTLERWLNYHFEYFITKDDLQYVRDRGVTHLRVPLPHWILGLKTADEPYVAGDRWKYFVRLCGWARELGLELWPNIHTAPGSQNGFDNSGRQKDPVTCQGWDTVAQHVQMSLDVIEQVTMAMVKENVTDVVTGFGLLNEPFLDCDGVQYRQFLDNGLSIVRNTLGPDVYVYVSDKFKTSQFNDGRFWLDPQRYNRTLLDTHYYQVFAPQFRELSPRQHIAFACHQGNVECCYEDGGKMKRPSRGIQAVSTEWSAAFDTLPVDMLKFVMDGIASDGVAPLLDRSLSQPRQDFLENYVQAQMVAFEAAGSELVHGWFYWTIKMEGGAFAEWDFSRGLREGWISVPPANTSSELLYGTCYEILFRTNDTMNVVHEYPERDPTTPLYWHMDDDVVVSHGQSLLPGYRGEEGPWWRRYVTWVNLSVVVLAMMLVGFTIRFWRRNVRRKGKGYTPIAEPSSAMTV